MANLEHTPWLKKLLIGELSWRRLGRSLVLIYIICATYIFFRADGMIFLPRSSSYQDSEDILKLSVTDTEEISATYLSNPEATYTILYIHGNAEDLGDIQVILERFQSWGFNVFAYDYRGYGTSDGQPSERNAYQEVEAAYTYLTQQLNISPDQIIVYGRSIGGGSATYLAAKFPIAGLVLESTFTSIFRVVVPFPVLPFDKFPNRSRLSQIQSPILVIHGENDQTIPIHHGRTLYESATVPKLSLWVPGADHNDVTWVAGDSHRQILVEFQSLIEKESTSSN